LRYMAPERLDDHCDERSDVYSLGATLYEMATLRPAQSADGLKALWDKILSVEPVRPRVWDRRIPLDLETIILKAMDKKPEKRYARMGDWAADLRHFMAGEPLPRPQEAANPVEPGTSPISVVDKQADNSSGRPSWAQRWHLAEALIGLAAVV